MTPMFNLSIVIPCFNEEENISILIERFFSCSFNYSTELVLVNNGSTDKTMEVLSEYTSKYTNISVVTIAKNIGYGNGIFQGILAAKGEYISWTHADLQTDICDIFTALKILENQENKQHCFIKGKRRGRPVFDSIFTIGMSLFETIMLHKWLWDINAQPNLFHRSLVSFFDEPPLDFSYDLYVYYQMVSHDVPVIRIPVCFQKRLYGESHWNTSLANKIKFIKRTIIFTLELKKRIKNFKHL